MGVVGEEFDKLKTLLNKPKNHNEAYSNKAYEYCVKADALRIRNYFLESIEKGETLNKYLPKYLFDEPNPEIKNQSFELIDVILPYSISNKFQSLSMTHSTSVDATRRPMAAARNYKATSQ